MGVDALVLPQAGRIGAGAIIGAGAVLTGPVAPGEIRAGNPASKVGHRGDGRAPAVETDP